MTFTEFLQALNEERLVATLNEYQPDQIINPVIHQRLLELLRRYFFVGGMPEAVSVFAESGSLQHVNEVHSNIIQTYREDFPKYIGSRSLQRMQHVFNFAARSIGKKVKYSQFSRDDASATIKSDIELLCMARVLSKVVHSHCNDLPLQAEMDDKVYKLLFLDIGLMNAICGINWRSLSELTDMSLVNEGRANNAELDYVIALNGQLLPIEVKAGASGSLKSLHQFMGEKKAPLAVRFDLNPPSRHTVSTRIKQDGHVNDIQYQLLSLPLYLVERLPALVG
jgi:predicted AAA+ superfamily ATPase